MPKVKLTGYVKYDGARNEPGTILDLSIEDAEHLQNAGVAELLDEEEDFDGNPSNDPEEDGEEDESEEEGDDPEEDGVSDDGESGGSGSVLQQPSEQPSVGKRKPRRQRKGTKHSA